MKRDRVNENIGKIRIRSFYKDSKIPVNTGYEPIQAWSGGTDPWRQLSPFLIGPVVTKEETAKNFENMWQARKVWEKIGSEVHVGPDGLPNEAWKKWHDTLVSKKEAVRRPNGYEKPLYAWWQGEKLGIIEARKRIYIPFLQELYRAHPAYQQLLTKVRNGENIVILEPDGPPAGLYPLGLEMNLELLIKFQDITEWNQLPGAYTNSKKYVPYGHGYVIGLTILQDLSQ